MLCRWRVLSTFSSERGVRRLFKFRRFGCRKCLFGPKIAPNRPKIVISGPQPQTQSNPGDSTGLEFPPKVAQNCIGVEQLAQTGEFRDRIRPKTVLKLGNRPRVGNVVPFRGRSPLKTGKLDQIWSRNSDFGSRVTKRPKFWRFWAHFGS